MFSLSRTDLEAAKNFAAEGVGPKAAAYPLAFGEIEKQYPHFRKNLKCCVGLSSGAIFSMFIAFNYSTEDTKKFTESIDFEKLLGNGVIGDFKKKEEIRLKNHPEFKKLLEDEAIIKRFLSNYGIYSNGVLMSNFEGFVKAKAGSVDFTFGQLHDLATKDSRFKDLYVITTLLCIIDGKATFVPFVFSHENAANTRIADALLASTAAPPLFKPVRLKDFGNGLYKQDPKGHLFLDGGLTAQGLAVIFFDAGAENIFKREIPKDCKSIPSCEPVRYGEYLLEALNAQHHEAKVELTPNKRTIAFQVNTQEEINAFTDPKYKPERLSILHPCQAFRTELADVFNQKVFGPREAFFKLHNLGRTFFLLAADSITLLDFGITKTQKTVLLKSGENSVKRQLSQARIGADFAKKSVPVDRLSARPLEEKKATAGALETVVVKADSALASSSRGLTAGSRD